MVLIYSKNGLSAIISTLLIILIVIILVSAIAVATIPFVRENFSGVKNCFEAFNGVVFVNSIYTCYQENEGVAGFTIKVNRDGINKIYLSLISSDGTSQVYTIKSGSNPNGLVSFGNGASLVGGSSQIDIPTSGQQLTYVAAGTDIVKIEVAPIVKGEVCSISDVENLNQCSTGISLIWTSSISAIANIN